MAAKDGRIDARDWSLLGVLSVLWGGSFFFNGLALKELPPLTLVLLRVALAALILLPVARAYCISFPRGLAGWKPFFAVAFFNNVLPFSLIVMGQTFIASGLASILNATTPLFTVVVMAAAGEERLFARRVVFFQILRRSGATNVMLVTLLIPVTAILLRYLVLAESISPREIAGALVIGSALLLIDGRVLKMFRAKILPA